VVVCGIEDEEEGEGINEEINNRVLMRKPNSVMARIMALKCAISLERRI